MDLEGTVGQFQTTVNWLFAQCPMACFVPNPSAQAASGPVAIATESDLRILSVLASHAGQPFTSSTKWGLEQRPQSSIKSPLAAGWIMCQLLDYIDVGFVTSGRSK